MEIRSTTSRSLLGWLCVHAVTSQSGSLTASSDGCEQNHRGMSEKGATTIQQVTINSPEAPEVILEAKKTMYMREQHGAGFLIC